MALDNAASIGSSAAATVTESNSDNAHPSLTERQQFWLDHILKENTSLNPQLRMKLLQAADPLFRANALMDGR